MRKKLKKKVSKFKVIGVLILRKNLKSKKKLSTKLYAKLNFGDKFMKFAVRV